jgi:hypothetical protein
VILQEAEGMNRWTPVGTSSAIEPTGTLRKHCDREVSFTPRDGLVGDGDRRRRSAHRAGERLLRPTSAGGALRGDAARAAKYELDLFELRRFIVSALGDASGYRKTDDKTDNTYESVHLRVKRALASLEARVEPSTPLTVLAHSMGGHIISNYVWDAQQRGMAKGLSYFMSMRTLGGIITFGCNIPLFVFAYEKSKIKPIKFPGARLPDWAKPHAKWLNFYDPDDVLGYPLKPINGAYSDVVDKDTAINVGGFFSSWNPRSHSRYWTDNSFTKPAAKFLGSFL